MATLVGVAVLALAAAIIIPDLMRAASARTTSREDTGRPIVPVGSNDPRLTSLESQIGQLAIIVGSLAGRVTGGAAAAGVSGAQAGISRGLAAAPVGVDESQRNVENAYSSAVAGGSAIGTNAGAFSGSSVGSFLIGIPAGIGQGAEQAGRAAALYAIDQGATSIYEVPAFGGVYRVQDWIGSLFGGAR